MISGNTKLLGVMGWPVGHSLSPLMHGAAIKSAGIDFTYVPLPVEPARLGEAVRGLRALGFRGCNVTVPHKVAVIPFLDELTPLARDIGAVNTIRVEPDGRLLGDNTDAHGVFDALAAETGFDARNSEVLILGAGGAARAAAFGAADRGARRVVILNRTVSRAADLAESLRTRFPAAEFEAGSPSDPRIQLGGIGAVLQMSSAGMAKADANTASELPMDPARLPGGTCVLEAVYSPLKTPFLVTSRARGLRVADGLSMLVSQGARSFFLWTGLQPDMAAMRNSITPH